MPTMYDWNIRFYSIQLFVYFSKFYKFNKMRMKYTCRYAIIAIEDHRTFVYRIYLISALKHRLWVHAKTFLMRQF